MRDGLTIPILIAGVGAWLYITFWFLQRVGSSSLNLFIGSAAMMMLFITMWAIIESAMTFGKKE